MSDSLIDALFANTVVASLVGMTFDGLVGNVIVPRVSGKAGVTWIDPETGTTTESDPTFDGVKLEPHYAVGKSVITYSMQKQSSIALDAFLETHLSQCLGEAVDAAFINGTGTGGQPLGILGTSGLGAVTGGAGGAALTYAQVVKLWAALRKANVNTNKLAWLTNPQVAAQLMTTPLIPATASAMVWQNGPDGAGKIMGYNAYASTNVPSNLGTGTNLSAFVVGDFSQSMIGLWSGLELRLDPYTGADSGNLIVRAFFPCDFHVGRPAALAAFTDVLA
jgi:HK97 family phage major capsid protein